MLAGQLATQGTLPDASSIVSIASQALDMPVKKATAYRARGLAKVRVFREYNEEFTYIEPYLEQFLEQNPGSKMYVKFDANGHFIRCALAPSAALDFLTHGLPLICVDMTHLYMRIRGQLALACSVYGNRQVMPLQDFTMRKQG